MKNPFSSVRIFTRETKDELLKCSWPTRGELRDSTIVVIVAIAILGAFTMISDFSMGQVVLLFTDFVS